jgi:hypothetical protein
MNTNPYRLAGWSALTAALVTAFTIVTFAIGISVGWDKVGFPNDIASIVMYFLHIPILLGLDKFLKPRPVQLWLGILAALVIGIVQVLFVGGIADVTTLPASVCTVILTLVYIAYNWQARQSQSLPNGLTLIGIIGNAGGAVASAASLISQDHPLVWIGGLVYLLNVVWLFWISRIWLKNTIGETQ